MTEAAKKILIMEDDETMLETLKVRLEQEGYVVTATYDGEEGLVEFWKVRPDLVIIDIMMPMKDGLNVIKDIHKKEPQNEVPIIILTNTKDSSYLAAALSNQVTSYLTKADHTLEDIVTVVKKKFEDLAHL
ncbi:MAG TPA: response regulator [Candidatus Paceibacterota bacterium]|nr:response regulator [Candidatus Paceibacterota bacterium]